MNTVNSPQSRCRAAIMRIDITPPIGIYHRMWGAALHDRATGIHRQLHATMLWIEPVFPATGEPQIIVSFDHCMLDTHDLRNIREAIHGATTVKFDNILITVSHTHGAGLMSRARSHCPGGELIGPYLYELTLRTASLAREVQTRLTAATFVYGTGRCNLAAHRDYFDSERGYYVCGFNPAGIADDTLLVARISDESGRPLAIVVNYACHPTTLAWDNTLISPDWVGAMREIIEESEDALCLFLQGASGDLGPREGYVGDTALADRNGRQVGYAALSALTTLPPSGTEYRYAGPVISGTVIGTWRHEPLGGDVRDSHASWCWEKVIVDLPYRHDLPSIEQATAEKEHWVAEESRARSSAANDDVRVRDCHARVEQCTRQIGRLNNLVPGRTYPLTLQIGLIGDAIWIFVPGELYQSFQTTLRKRFSPHPVIVTTHTNDWLPGYIPPASIYGYGIYQEVIAATAPGCMETLIETIARRVAFLQNRTN